MLLMLKCIEMEACLDIAIANNLPHASFSSNIHPSDWRAKAEKGWMASNRNCCADVAQTRPAQPKPSPGHPSRLDSVAHHGKNQTKTPLKSDGLSAANHGPSGG